MTSIKKYINGFTSGNSITAAMRILLGLMFIFSGYFKAADQDSFLRILKLYNILPESILPISVIIMPFMELTLGIFLILGYKIRASSLISMVLMVIFLMFLLINIYRGESFDCGCFKFEKFGLGIDEKIGFKAVIRNIILFVLFAIIFRAKKHKLSLDNTIWKIFY